jgi:NitT/TauT family transport system permease protein
VSEHAVLTNEPPADIRKPAGAYLRYVAPILVVLILLLFVGLWQLASDQGWIDPFFFSSPTQIWHALRVEQANGVLWSDASTTVREALLGFAYGTVAGIAIGFVLGHSKMLGSVLLPILNLANTLPRVALAPIFILWFGIGEKSKVILVFSVVVVILIFNTFAATQTVDRDLIVNARMLGASKLQVIRKLTLPWCLPWIFSGIRIALAWSIGAAVIGEYIAAKQGIGMRIFNDANLLNQAGVFAGCLMLLVLSAGMFAALGVVERYVLRWRPAQRGL